MPNSPLITIITVTYNAKDHIEKTILSVINQNYENIEYIIIDGASTDGTTQIISQYENKINFWQSQKDNGIYDAMNKGIDKVNGELVLFLNAGDILYNNTVLHDFIETYFRPEPNNLYMFPIQTDKGKIQNLKLLWLYPNYKLPTSHQGMLYPGKILKKTSFDNKYKIAADFHHFARIKNKVKLVSVNLILSIYDTTGVSTINYKKRDKEYRKIYTELSVHWIYRVIKRLHEIHEALKRIKSHK